MSLRKLVYAILSHICNLYGVKPTRWLNSDLQLMYARERATNVTVYCLQLLKTLMP